ncbi:MAG TPA: helix-turn-helix domain-containing protein [Mycobacteriales bacterium]|nr:helix-turn-helix domain-containing protein [Mycobacteriales bacterium]
MNADLAGRLHDADPAKLGERIRNLRLARGLTQSALADGAVTIGYVSRIESGQRRPDVALLERFARLLDTTPEHLITGVEPARADEIALALLNVELSLETGAAQEALAGIESLAAGGELPQDVRDRAALLRARALEALGRYDEAIVVLEQIVDAQGPTLVPAMLALSRCHREVGDLNRAVEVGEHALAALAEAGIDGGDEAIQLTVTLAAAYFERGDISHGARIAEEAIRRAEEMGSAEAQAAAYWEASIFESRRGQSATAVQHARHALALLTGGEDRRNLARLHIQLGNMLLRLDPPAVDEAIAQLEGAKLKLAASSASVVDVAHCDVALARARTLAGDPAAAADIARQTLETTRAVAPSVAAEAASILGVLAAGRGDTAAAAGHYREAVAHLTGVGQDRRAAQLWLELGAHLEALGDSEGSRDAYRRAAVAAGLQIPAEIRVTV